MQSRKRKAETGPLPEASCHKQKRRRAGAQDATVRQDVQSVISIESATIEPRAKLVLSIKRITDDEPRSAAKNEKSRHSGGSLASLTPISISHLFSNIRQEEISRE